jgi:hypothetical protein
MKNTLALIVLIACIWIPELSARFYPIEGWMKEPISNTFVTLYVLMFFVLILNLTKTTKIEK